MSRLRQIIREEINNIPSISKIKEILPKYIELNQYKILRESDTVLLMRHNRDDISLEFRLDMIPNELWIGLLAKIEVRSISLADPTKNYQTTSARRVQHKKINIRDYVDTIKKVDKKLESFFKKITSVRG